MNGPDYVDMKNVIFFKIWAILHFFVFWTKWFHSEPECSVKEKRPFAWKLVKKRSKELSFEGPAFCEWGAIGMSFWPFWPISRGIFFNFWWLDNFQTSSTKKLASLLLKKIANLGILFLIVLLHKSVTRWTLLGFF